VGCGFPFLFILGINPVVVVATSRAERLGMDITVVDIDPAASGYLDARAATWTDLHVLYGYIRGSGDGYAVARLGGDFQVLECLPVIRARNQ